MAEFETKCPHCGQSCTVEDEWIGMGGKCPSCNETFTIEKNKSTMTAEPLKNAASDFTVSELLTIAAKKMKKNLEKQVGQYTKEKLQAGKVEDLEIQDAVALINRMRRYFSISPWLVLVISLFLGFVFFVSGIIAPHGGWILLIGIVLAWIGIWYYRTSPKDSEVDAIAEAEFEKLKSAALKKLGVDEEEISYAEPIQFSGWSFEEHSKRAINDPYLRKANDVMGKDGLWRSPVLGLHFFAFSENMIHYFCRYVSLVSANHKETTEEYFYSDIISVKTDSMDYKKGKIHAESFILTTSGGTSVSCSIMDSDMADASVNAMRSLLKQKKMQEK